MVYETTHCNLNDLALLNSLYPMSFVLQEEPFHPTQHLRHLVRYLHEIVGCVLFLVTKVRYCNHISRHDNCEYTGTATCLTHEYFIMIQIDELVHNLNDDSVYNLLKYTYIFMNIKTQLTYLAMGPRNTNCSTD